MRRPGNLRGVDYMLKRPRHSRFGEKGSMEPAPGPPPAGTWTGTKRIKSAINKVTKKYYAQDPGCAEGEVRKKCKDVKKQVGPCSFTECCDVVGAFGPYPFIGPVCIPGECDHPDTPTDCEDDPAYLEIPDGVYKTCKEVRAAFTRVGIPASFANTYCEDEDIPETLAPVKPKEEKKPTSKPGPKAAAEPKGPSPAVRACMQGAQSLLSRGMITTTRFPKGIRTYCEEKNSPKGIPPKSKPPKSKPPKSSPKKGSPPPKSSPGKSLGGIEKRWPKWLLLGVIAIVCIKLLPR